MPIVAVAVPAARTLFDSLCNALQGPPLGGICFALLELSWEAKSSKVVTLAAVIESKPKSKFAFKSNV